jgi:hypothetical protein
MADKTATFTFGCVYEDDLQGTVTVPPVSVSVPYQATFGGDVDVPALAAAATVFALSFGSIASATGLLVQNNTGQDLGVRINGAIADEFQVPDGSCKAFALPATPATNGVTAISLVTTEEQVLAGSIAYRLFGDAVEA